MENIQITRFLQQNVEEISLSQVATMNIPAQFDDIHPGRYPIENFRFFLKRTSNGSSVVDVVCGDIKFPLSILWRKGSHGPLVDGMDLATFLRSENLIITNVRKESKVVVWHGMKREIQFTTIDYVVD